jgi:hypothetical protein
MTDIEQKTVIFSANEKEAKTGFIKLIDHLHTYVVRHTLIVTYYKAIN